MFDSQFEIFLDINNRYDVQMQHALFDTVPQFRVRPTRPPYKPRRVAVSPRIHTNFGIVLVQPVEKQKRPRPLGVLSSGERTARVAVLRRQHVLAPQFDDRCVRRQTDRAYEELDLRQRLRMHAAFVHRRIELHRQIGVSAIYSQARDARS